MLTVQVSSSGFDICWLSTFPNYVSFTMLITVDGQSGGSSLTEIVKTELSTLNPSSSRCKQSNLWEMYLCFYISLHNNIVRGH